MKAEVSAPVLQTRQAANIFSEKHIRKGLEKAGNSTAPAATTRSPAYPDLQPATCRQCRRRRRGNEGRRRTFTPRHAEPGSTGRHRRRHHAGERGQAVLRQPDRVRGNTTTRDNVIRREMSLVEAAPFNTEALKFGIKRLNQLGYSESLEGDAIQVEKTPDADNKVDVHTEVRGAEPEPADVRCRRFAVRRILRTALVPDVEFPRARRDVQFRAGGQPRAKLPGRLHRAVSCSIGR